MKNIKLFLLLGVVAFAFYSFKSFVQEKEWVVPANYKTMKNPTSATDKQSMSIGKSLYSKNCQPCHGKEGLGDGPKAAEQKGDLGDFSSKATQSQSDGALFFKITKGRNDMPAFEKKIPDAEDRWLIVNYLRTLK